MDQDCQQKLETVKRLQNDIEKMQCCLLCEREQNKTLVIDHDDTKSKLAQVTEKNKRLQEDLDKFMEDSQSKVILS